MTYKQKEDRQLKRKKRSLEDTHRKDVMMKTSYI